MSDATYDNKIITQYLLGVLPEAASERLDELGVTDDEFAGALSAAEKDLVDAYVQGELDGAALETFKAYYLASPIRRERVQFAQMFQRLASQGTTAQIAEVRAGSPTPKRKGSGWFSALRTATVARPAWRWGAAAAALALLVIGSWSVLENVRLRRQMSQTEARRDALGQRERELQRELEQQRTSSVTTAEELARVRAEREHFEQELTTQREQQRRAEQQRAAGQQQTSPPGGGSVAAFILAPQMRDAAQIREVSVPPDAAHVAMRLVLEPNDYSVYRVALLDQSGNRTLWRSSGKLTARTTGGEKTLSVGFRASLLKSQAVYLLRVMSVPSSGLPEVVGDYPFRVVK